MSALTHRQKMIRKDLLGSAMNRLVNALGAPPSDTYADTVAHRVRFIARKSKALPVDTQLEIIEKLKENFEILCPDESLRARLLDQLGYQAAA